MIYTKRSEYLKYMENLYNPAPKKNYTTQHLQSDLKMDRESDGQQTHKMVSITSSRACKSKPQQDITLQLTGSYYQKTKI